MKKLSFILSLVAMFAASALFVGCKNDDIADPGTDKPTPTPTHGDYDPNLDGIWLQTAQGVVGQYEDPIAIEYSSILVMEPANGVGAAYLQQDGKSHYFEFGMYADADSLTLIEGKFLQMIEEAFEKEGKAMPAYKDLIVPEGSSQWYGKWTYKMVGKDSLVFYDGKYGDLDAYTCYSRLTEAEAEAKTRGFWSSLKDKVVSGVKIVANKIAETAKDAIQSIKDAFSSDDHDGMSKSMDELNNSRTGGWTYTDWMSKIPGNTPLSHISIPATHDACSYGVGILGKTINANCQTLSLDDQLKAGVRGFDIRTSLDFDSEWFKSIKDFLKDNFKITTFPENTLGTYHGNLSCDIPFKEVLRTMKKYLNTHKNETVILRIAFENKKVMPWQNYDEAGRIASTQAYHAVLRDKEFVDYIKPYYPTDTLGSARGKILVLNYNAHGLTDQDRIGSYATGYGNEAVLNNCIVHKYEKKPTGNGNDSIVCETESCVFWEQNVVTMGFFTDQKIVDQKKKSITDFAVDANKQNDIPFFITQLNANTGVVTDLHCRNFAEMFNAYAFQMLWDSMQPGATRYKGGMYSMDYAGVGLYSFLSLPVSVYGDRLVWAVIENNFHKNDK